MEVENISRVALVLSHEYLKNQIIVKINHIDLKLIFFLPKIVEKK